MERRKQGRQKVYMLILLAIVAVLNLTAWCSNAFCDWYIAFVFPIWVNTYGRFMGIVPFSVGEIMLLLGAVLVLITILLSIPFLVIFLRSRKKKSSSLEEAVVGFCKRFYLFVTWVFLIVCLVMTLNCTILYHASTFSDLFFKEVEAEYSVEELIAVRNLVVERCNELATQMERDEQGNILCDIDIEEQAIVDMKKLGKSYSGLDGFYPSPKPLAASDFFSQQYMQGYYFPFSLEANYNQVMHIMNRPSTICHELAHLRGYIFEDEANFVSFMACANSSEKIMEYSGYLSILYYLDNDFYKAIDGDREKYLEQPLISNQVRIDNVFLTDEEWDRINKKALIDTEVVDSVSDGFTDTVLKVNGVKDGMVSYSRVVKLLLMYYREAGVI